MTEPFVLARLSDQAASAALAAAFEEEGVPLVLEAVAGAPELLAREAARTAPLGIGVAGDDSRLVLVLSGGPARPYLEARVADARSFGHAAARLAARRPLFRYS